MSRWMSLMKKGKGKEEGVDVLSEESETRARLPLVGTARELAAGFPAVQWKSCMTHVIAVGGMRNEGHPNPSPATTNIIPSASPRFIEFNRRLESSSPSGHRSCSARALSPRIRSHPARLQTSGPSVAWHSYLDISSFFALASPDSALPSPLNSVLKALGFLETLLNPRPPPPWT